MSVERMNEVLCNNVYAFFASKYGTKCHINQHQSKQSSHQRVLKKVRGEKQVERQLRQLRKYGNEEDFRKLEHEFHTLVKRLSKVSRKAGNLKETKDNYNKEKHVIKISGNLPNDS